MIKVGITGGIGSGKSTFCSFWEKEGVPVIYADQLAKKIMTEDAALINKVKETFGERAYKEDGDLNRSFLADEAFARGRVEELNAIVHPALRRRIREIAAQMEADGTSIFAYEAAILLNEGRPADLDYVILIRAGREERIRRTTERDGSEYRTVEDRMNKQPDFEQLIPLCDFLVENDGEPGDLRIKAVEILRHLRNLHP